MLRREVQTFPTFTYPRDRCRMAEKGFNPIRTPQMERLLTVTESECAYDVVPGDRARDL